MRFQILINEIERTHVMSNIDPQDREMTHMMSNIDPRDREDSHDVKY